MEDLGQSVSLISINHGDFSKPMNNSPDPNFDFIQYKEAISLI